jgi:hypothetical protein
LAKLAASLKGHSQLSSLCFNVMSGFVLMSPISSTP